jgi:hypothetical protein
MPIVTFEDPGPRRGAPSLTTAAVALREVMQRPATWARIASYGSAASASSYVSRLRSRLDHAPTGQFEFTVRTRVDGSADVFAIFLPKKEL